MFSFPDGARHLPEIDRVKITGWLGHEEWILVQTGDNSAELQIGRESDPNALDCALAEIEEKIGHAFNVEAISVAGIPLTSGGKRHFSLNELALNNR